MESDVVVARDDDHWDRFGSAKHRPKTAKIFLPTIVFNPLALVEHVAKQENHL